MAHKYISKEKQLIYILLTRHRHLQSIFSVEKVKFDLEVLDKSTYKAITILSKVFCIFCPTLVVQAWTGDELLRWQTHDWHAHTQIHTQTQAATIPEGPNTWGKNDEIKTFFPYSTDYQFWSKDGPNKWVSGWNGIFRMCTISKVRTF